MRFFGPLQLLLLILLAPAGCDLKPQPAETPKHLIEPPKTRPRPNGGGNAPAQMSKLPVSFWPAI
jgi:hypothetical protein